MSREHERLQRLVTNEAGVISAYFAAKHWYLRGQMAKTFMLDALGDAAPFLEDPDAEVRELSAFDHERRVTQARVAAPPLRLEELPPSREPPRGPYR